jgi:hypothetical protein
MLMRGQLAAPGRVAAGRARVVRPRAQVRSSRVGGGNSCILDARARPPPALSDARASAALCATDRLYGQTEPIVHSRDPADAGVRQRRAPSEIWARRSKRLPAAAAAAAAATAARARALARPLPTPDPQLNNPHTPRPANLITNPQTHAHARAHRPPPPPPRRRRPRPRPTAARPRTSTASRPTRRAAARRAPSRWARC